MNKEAIKSVLATIPTGDLLEKSKNLLATLGYQSERTLELSGTVHDFFQEFPPLNPNTKTEQAFRKHAESVQLIFQFTSDEITEDTQQTLFESDAFDKGWTDSFIFCAVELQNNSYSRTQYAEFTREINKRLLAPTVVLFRAANYLTIGFTDRRPHKTDGDRDVLGQVTLIKDIRLNDPHRAHLDILSELSLEACADWMDENRKPKNFDGLLSAWLAKLDTEALNKQFYRNLFAWYEWAIKTATFPTDENRVLKPEEHVIRLITRLLFIWFIKEKGLVAEALFNKAQIQDLLGENDFDSGDAYYRAVLQNLFFATLNTEIDERRFSKGNYSGNRNFSRYRYKKQMRDPDKLLELFAKTPFINGGLFDCLDTFDAPKDGGYRIDCFSDVDYKKLSIPNRLFFDVQQGLIPLLEHYKFTVEENTPIEQEVALDPELLGRVFENLLAAYNPETGATVRKQTGSYYTPRPIVAYMVDEALVATLSQKCDPTDGDTELWAERLHYLLDYAQAFDDAHEWFDDPETDGIVRAISELKILDPAVGSGAFPMGMLHKLTLALRRLDPDNTRWEKLQKERAVQRTEAAYDTQDDQTRREELLEIDETFKRYRDSDFGRKLYLIQNSIFGVDIQSVACQIAKLRFFISLAIEQEPEQDTENFGIKPLPNLETRFIAANTLIGLAEERTLTSQKAQNLEWELSVNRERHFHATTRQQKRTCKQKDTELRTELATELKSIGMPADDAEKISQWDPYDQNATADWFDSEWMFGITEGFDVVIGNPPYIQLQKEGGRLGNLYQNRGFDTFVRTGDIYCLFYEKANQLLQNNGHVCFITSNKWMRAGYGKKLRDYFGTLTQPIQLLDMGPDVFDATVDTNILLFQKIVADTPAAFIGISLGSDFDRQTSSIARYLSDNGVTLEIPAKGEPWTILSSAELNLKRKIEDVGKPLKDWSINIYRGIVTGCNEAFIINEAKRQQLIDQDLKSAEIIKPLLRGRDITRYHVKQAGLYVLATGYDLDIPRRYPAIYEHLEVIGEQIESGKIKTRGKGLFDRDDQGVNWWNLRACAYYSEFDKEKIVYPETTHSANFFCDSGEFFLDKTCFMITGSDLKILVGLLSSTLMTFAYKRYCSGTVLGAKGYQYNKHALEKLPIAKIPASQQQSFITLVDQILDAKHTTPEADTSDLENEIDTLVYELYNLTEDEIAIVEGRV
ncbi:type II restriction endonuclease [Candidatus Poribacteria bacterium]|nr:MAG: type II restriction endonuclease [Candidatus Poribacteria bacterium]